MRDEQRVHGKRRVIFIGQAILAMNALPKIKGNAKNKIILDGKFD